VPKKWLLIGGLVMVIGHNLLDGVDPDSLGIWSFLWKVLHVQSSHSLGSLQIYIFYPVIPWIAVMALGYVFADFYRMEASKRQQKMLLIGVVMTVLFFVIRGINVYGDMNPWSVQSTTGMTIVSFLNVTKYPPSLLYLLLTLGPSIILLSLFERIHGKLSDFLIVFGRVPMFFYIIHLYLIHSVAVVLGVIQGYSVWDMMHDFEELPEGYGMGLVASYIFWIALIVVSYYLCRWYVGFKKGKTHPFYSYI